MDCTSCIRAEHTISQNHPQCITKFINRDNVNDLSYKEYKYNTSLLHITAIHGHIQCAQVLLDFGADINIVDNSYTTPLFPAVYNGYVDFVAFLLERGAHINHKNNRNTTPVFEAVLTNQFEMVKLLIDRGAEIDIVDIKGNSLISKARTQKMRDYLEYCLYDVKEPECY